MCLQVIDVIDQVYDGKDNERDWEAAEGIMLHRCGVDLKWGNVLGYTGLEVAKAFIGQKPEWAEVAKATGGQNAYTIMVGSDLGPPEFNGKVWQCLPMDEIGWHGRRFSRGYIGYSWIADPRKKPLSESAWNTMVELCARTCVARNWDPYKAVKGHGEVPGSHDGSKAPGKNNACPGLSQQKLNVFRDDVAVRMRQQGLLSLKDAGVVLA